jgi:predicted Zn finger-like uncharacterized protein
MDVTCTRCNTSYEFEEGLVSTTGTTVKCTNCGHLFKVHRGAETATLPDPPAELRWRVRRADGSVHTLQSLADLTPLITAGQFRRDDELSRTGQVWRRLGEVAELAPLFEGGRARLRSDPPTVLTPPLAPPPPMPSERGANDARRISDPPLSPPSDAGARARRQSGFESMGLSVDLLVPPSSPLVPPPQAVRAAAGERPSVPLPPRASEPARVPLPKAAPVPAPVPVPVPAPAAAVTAPSLIADQERDPQLQPPRPRLWLWVLLVSVVVAGAGAGINHLLRPHPAGQDSPARALIARGDAELATHRIARFEPAIAAYSQALDSHRDDPHILSSLSRVYAVWSQALRDDASTAEAPNALPRDDREAKRLAEQAKIYGERAAQRNPGNEEAGVAYSDALRLTGNLISARGELNRARATEGVPAAETLRVAALLAIDEANGELQAGRGLAEQAVAQDPNMIRARILLARCLARAGDLEGAELHVEAVRKLDANHPLIAHVRGELQAASRGAGGSVAAGPAAAGAAGQATPGPAGGSAAPVASAAPNGSSAKPSERAPAASKPAGSGTGASTSAGASSSEGATELANRGEALLERGSVPAAARAFEKALELDPSLARAKVGLGYVALERGQPAQAVGLFRGAAASGNAEALIGLGDAYRRLGKLRAALTAYRNYVQRFPRGDRGSIARHQIELLNEQLQQPAGSTESE